MPCLFGRWVVIYYVTSVCSHPQLRDCSGPPRCVEVPIERVYIMATKSPLDVKRRWCLLLTAFTGLGGWLSSSSSAGVAGFSTSDSTHSGADHDTHSSVLADVTDSRNTKDADPTSQLHFEYYCRWRCLLLTAGSLHLKGPLTYNTNTAVFYNLMLILEIFL